MDLITRRALMMAQRVEPEPQYVTDGIILWLDGINKGGTDGNWTDLVNGHVFTNRGCTVLSDGFSFDGVDDDMMNSTFNTVTTPMDNTIEVVVSAVDATGVHAIFCAGAPAGNKNTKRFYVAITTQLVCLATTSSYPTISTPTPAAVHSIVSCPDGGLYINGVAATPAANGYYNFQGASNRIGSGYYPTTVRHRFKGTIHAIRIYNRSLTAEEVAHNYALDLQRFNF